MSDWGSATGKMNQVLPQLLWLGHAGEGRDWRQIHWVGIKALVLLAAEEPLPQPPRAIIYCRIPLLDGAGNEPELLSLAVHTVVTLIRAQVPTLICCGAGMSRSPAIAAAALAMVYKEPPGEGLKRVLKYHPGDVSPSLWREVVGLGSLLPT
jgi:hypothetical protein